MRWRLLAAFLGVMAVMLVAQDVPLASHLRRVERDRQLADIERDAFILAGQTLQRLRPADGAAADLAAALDDQIRHYARQNDRDVVVVDAGGVVVSAAGRGADVGDDLAADDDIATALAAQAAAGERDASVVVAVPVLDGAAAVGAVRISAPSDDIADRAGRRVRGLVAVASISLGAAAIVALILSSTITRPLRRLQRSTEGVAAGDFGGRADEDGGPPELRRLAASFNAMTERVARLVDQQRSFAGDASHQLRTPLTALRLQLEQAGMQVAGDPDGAVHTIAAAETEVLRLQRLIDGLLLLARTDPTGATTPVPVPVDRVVAERAAGWGALAEEQGITLVVAGRPDVIALAIPDGVEQIIDNYVDNALTYAPAGSTVELAVETPEPGWVEVHVRDEGPGLPADELDQAFRRFWRAPGATETGSGLGLAIVAQLAEASGGRAELRNRPRGGLDALVRLRSATPTDPPRMPIG